MTNPAPTIRRCIASTLIVSCATMGLPMTAHAGIVSTDAVLSSATTATDLSTTNTIESDMTT